MGVADVAMNESDLENSVRWCPPVRALDLDLVSDPNSSPRFPHLRTGSEYFSRICSAPGPGDLEKSAALWASGRCPSLPVDKLAPCSTEKSKGDSPRWSGKTRGGAGACPGGRADAWGTAHATEGGQSASVGGPDQMSRRAWKVRDRRQEMHADTRAPAR